MRAYIISTVAAAVLAAAAVALGTVPSEAQTTTTDVVRQKPVRVAVAGRPPARVTVRKRSYLDPGTETKTRTEHYQDYVYSPTHGMAPRRNSTLFMNGPSLPFTHDRMPFPNCLDLPGFCQ